MIEKSFIQLEDIAEVRGGKRLPKGNSLTKEKTSHPYIRIISMKNKETIELNDRYEYVDESVQKKISKYIVESEDIIISIVGTIGLVSFIGPSLDGANLTENCMRISINKKEFLSKYVFYYLNSYVGQQQIQQGIVGSVQPKLPMYNIKKIKIPVIPFEEQQKIVKKLDSISNKIALNTKLISQLEEYTHLVFYKWFVDFNFPNENGQPYKKNNGKTHEIKGKTVPIDWSIDYLESFVSKISNGDWGNGEPFEDAVETHCIRGADIPHIKYGKIKDIPLRYIKNSRENERVLRNGNIVIEASGGSPTQSTGRTVLIRDSLLNNIEIPLYFTNFSKMIVPREGYSMFLYLLLNNFYQRGAFFHFEGKTSGIRNLLINNLLKKLEYVHPSIDILEKFERQIGVIWDKIFTLGHENELLEETRDLLSIKLFN